jgi:hypothetical protein
MDRVKPPKFNGSASWAVFHRQFEAVADHKWTFSEKASYLLAVLHGQAVDVQQSIPPGTTYEDIVGALKGRYGDHQLATAYREQLKARTQLIGESQQEFAAVIEQLAHQALVRLPIKFIQKEAAHTFIDGVRGREIKQHLLMGDKSTISKALSQTMKLEVAKVAAGTPERLPMRQVTTAPMGMLPPPIECHRDEKSECWQCGNAGHLSTDYRLRPGKQDTDH